LNENPLRVLHILSGDLWGGAEAQMLLQCAALRECGIDAQALFFNRRETEARYREAGIPTHVADENAGLISCIRDARRSIEEFRPAVLVSHGYKEAFAGAVAGMRKKIPLVTTFHGATEQLPGFKGMKMGLFLLLHKFIARRIASGVVTVTDPLARQLRLDDLPKLAIVPNVVQLHAGGDPVALPQRPAVVCVGRLAPVKRFDRAIRIIARVPGAHLYIAGDGPERAALEAASRSLKVEDRTHFLGFCKSGRLVIAAGELFLLCSDSEGLPTVLLEAIASRRPIVASDLPGVRGVLEQFPGYPFVLVNPGDEDGFVEAVSKLLSAPREIPPEAIQPLSLYTPAAAAQRSCELYRRILARQ
jgi:glycosyltransferase involved in cell wall biosynthesis